MIFCATKCPWARQQGRRNCTAADSPVSKAETELFVWETWWEFESANRARVHLPPPRSSEGVLLNMWIFILSFSIRNRFLSFVPLHIANFLPLHFFLLYLQNNSSSRHFIVADNQNKWGKWTRFRKSVGSHEGNSNILRREKKEKDSHCVLWPLRIRISGVIWLGRLFSFPSLSRCFCFKDVKKKILSVILGAL